MEITFGIGNFFSDRTDGSLREIVSHIDNRGKDFNAFEHQNMITDALQDLVNGKHLGYNGNKYFLPGHEPKPKTETKEDYISSLIRGGCPTNAVGFVLHGNYKKY